VFQFELYKKRGLLPTTLTHPAHQDNLILLCANCHVEFDSSIPVITIMPTDLQYFIGYEVDDYQRRLVAASSGCEIQRKVPTSQDYIGAGGRYKVIRNKYTATEEKEWSGPGSHFNESKFIFAATVR
jgi:hypothetical protein